MDDALHDYGWFTCAITDCVVQRVQSMDVAQSKDLFHAQTPICTQKRGLIILCTTHTERGSGNIEYNDHSATNQIAWFAISITSCTKNESLRVEFSHTQEIFSANLRGCFKFQSR